jgi:hypothetical protein
MQCETSKQQIIRSEGQQALYTPELRDHLADCEECNDFAERQYMTSLLACLPAPAISEGFADRMLQRAWADREVGEPQGQGKMAGALALAACLLLTVGLVWQAPPSGMDSLTGNQSPHNISASPGIMRSVDLLMVSNEALPNARITLRMNGEIGLAGYLDRKEFSWATPLIAGNNQLTLPVELQGSNNASIVVRIDSDGASKEMVLSVEATETQRAALMFI